MEAPILESGDDVFKRHQQEKANKKKLKLASPVLDAIGKCCDQKVLIGTRRFGDLFFGKLSYVDWAGNIVALEDVERDRKGKRTTFSFVMINSHNIKFIQLPQGVTEALPKPSEPQPRFCQGVMRLTPARGRGRCRGGFGGQQRRGRGRGGGRGMFVPWLRARKILN